MLSKKNLYIVVEGLGGAGKGTVLDDLGKRFMAKGYRVVSTFEPGGTAEADKLRQELFIKKASGVISVEEELSYVFAARALNMRQVVLPSLASSELTVVLKDRDYLSSFVYQVASGASRDMLLRFFRAEYEASGFPRPDLRLLLLLPQAEAMRRRFEDGVSGDGFDLQPYDYWMRVASGYDDEAMNINCGRGLFRRETVVVDATPTIEIVCDCAWKTASDRLNLDTVEDYELRLRYGRENRGGRKMARSWYR